MYFPLPLSIPPIPPFPGLSVDVEALEQSSEAASALRHAPTTWPTLMAVLHGILSMAAGGSITYTSRPLMTCGRHRGACADAASSKGPRPRPRRLRVSASRPRPRLVVYRWRAHTARVSAAYSTTDRPTPTDRRRSFLARTPLSPPTRTHKDQLFIDPTPADLPFVLTQVRHERRCMCAPDENRGGARPVTNTHATWSSAVFFRSPADVAFPRASLAAAAAAARACTSRGAIRRPSAPLCTGRPAERPHGRPLRPRALERASVS